MKRGQVARMGEHTLACADCLQWLPAIPDGSVDLVFADLPYGVTKNKWDKKIPLAPLWAELLRVGKRNCAFVLTATQPFATTLICSQPKLFRYDVIWEKTRASGFLNARRAPLRAHEAILIFAKHSPTYNPQKTPGKRYSVKGSRTCYNATYGTMIERPKPDADSGLLRYPLSVFSVPSPDLDRGCFNTGQNHPTQKPVALLEWIIRTYTNPGDTVLDPTAGSGTTLIACENTGRIARACEMDPGYCAATLTRWQTRQGTVASPPPAARGQLALFG